MKEYQMSTNTVPAGFENCVSVDEAKKLKTPGTKFFVQKTGSYGVILESVSARGKPQAEMTCTAGGPNHVREISDWHQCGRSPEMTKKKYKSGGKNVTVKDPEVMLLEAQLKELASTKRLEEREAKAQARSTQKAIEAKTRLQAKVNALKEQLGTVTLNS